MNSNNHIDTDETEDGGDMNQFGIFDDSNNNSSIFPGTSSATGSLNPLALTPLPLILSQPDDLQVESPQHRANISYRSYSSNNESDATTISHSTAAASSASSTPRSNRRRLRDPDDEEESEEGSSQPPKRRTIRALGECEKHRGKPTKNYEILTCSDCTLTKSRCNLPNCPCGGSGTLLSTIEEDAYFHTMISYAVVRRNRPSTLSRVGTCPCICCLHSR